MILGLESLFGTSGSYWSNTEFLRICCQLSKSSEPVCTNVLNHQGKGMANDCSVQLFAGLCGMRT